MTTGQTPVVQQRWLRSELRRAREQAGKTQKEVADELEWSPSKVIRIETGAVGVSKTDLKALLALLGITDPATVDMMVTAARSTKKQAWWDEYRNQLSAQFRTEISYESSSVRLRQFQGLMLPGLLQTPDYAREIISLYDQDPADVEIGIQIRMRRQQLLTEPGGPEVFFVLDEAVIRRQVGGPDVWRAQLEKLREIDRRPNVHIQVLPFTVGAHPGIRGSFTIFEFPLGDRDFAVRLEQNRRDVLIRDNPEETSLFVETFFELEALASPKGRLDEVLDRVLTS
jgi:transcriptional regulator with XRE-family HTH domain